MPSLLLWKQEGKQFCKNFKLAKLPTLHYLRRAFLIEYSTKGSENNDTTNETGSENYKETSEIPSKLKKTKLPLMPPEEPTTCCMSGCANCVWLEYAEKLCEYYKDGGEKAVKEINERISDPNIKAYILHELRMRNKT